LLLVAAAVALAWANSPWSGSYFALWQTPIAVELGPAGLRKPLLLWINDGLMAGFFLLVGLEIKREVLVGELASPRQAALPLSAAAGGMAVPALLYVLIAGGGETAAGWAVPMATDIAFALGVLALLGRGLPGALRVFLAALAIADDLGAVLVIALFFTAKVSVPALLVAAALFAVLVAMNRLGVRALSAYAGIGLLLWVAVLKSGVHATVAGVLLAAAVPVGRHIDVTDFVDRARTLLDRLAERGEPGRRVPTKEEHEAIHSLEVGTERVDSPLLRLEHGLLPWITYGVMPAFALANAGVRFGADPAAALTAPVTLGVIAGLVVGKQVGVTGFAWAAVRAGAASLPDRVTWRQIYGVACLCGIGFTMSIFIGGLAFEGPLLDRAKTGILAGSLVSGLMGWIALRSAREGPGG
ncbi:MAG: Na+/H+ antiporter NhaA, partial [Gemmatimonadota bacterium]